MMTTWAVIAIGLACLVYWPALRRHGFSREGVLHFRNGVCEENGIGIWKYLRYVGLRRELGKELWPEGHDRVLTAEYGPIGHRESTCTTGWTSRSGNTAGRTGGLKACQEITRSDTRSSRLFWPSWCQRRAELVTLSKSMPYWAGQISN